MAIRKHTSRSSSAVQQLLSEFILELDHMSSNGTLKTYGYSAVSDLREHYLNQCASDEQTRLAEEIDLILNAKLNYFRKETLLYLSDDLEQSIKDKILSIVRDLKKNAPRFAGALVQSGLLQPLRWIRSVIEPAVANTILTYTIVMNPPAIENPPISAVAEAKTKTTPSAFAETSLPSRGYEALTKVQSYTDDQIPSVARNDAAGIRHNPRIAPNGQTTIQTASLEKAHAVNLTDTMAIAGKQNLQTPTALHTTGITIPNSLRPVSEIQEVFYINEYKLNGAIQAQLKTSKNKRPHGKLAVKMIITPAGTPKQVEVTSDTNDKDISQRVTIQLLRFRFSSVDTKLGDQTVYHTIYF